MLAVIGVFVLLMAGLSVGGLVIGVVVQTVFGLILPVINLLGLALGFGTMVGKLITSLVSFFVKFVIMIVIFCSCVLPFIGRGWRHLCLVFPHIVNNISWHLDILREGIEDAVNQQGNWLIYLWGIILVPLYYISNQLQNATRNGNNARRNDDDNVDGDFEDENPEWARQNRDNDVRNRQTNQQPPQPQGQRLYPVLPDINYNEFDRREANNNDNNVGNVFLNNNNMNQANDNDDRLCIICFDHERNVAVFPCGHTLLCEQCTNTVMRRNRLCPVCQGRIQEYRTVYL